MPPFLSRPQAAPGPWALGQVKLLHQLVGPLVSSSVGSVPGISLPADPHLTYLKAHIPVIPGSHFLSTCIFSSVNTLFSCTYDPFQKQVGEQREAGVLGEGWQSWGFSTDGQEGDGFK